MSTIAILFGSLVLLTTGLIFFAGGYLLWSFFTMRLFQKAGVQGAWRAWVPFYSQMIFLKLGDVNPFLFLFVLVGWIDVIGPIANLFVWVMMCLAAYRIGMKLQKESWWVVLFAIPPITFVWLGVVALDASRWNAAVPPAPWAANGFLADRTAWEGVPAQAAAGQAAWTQAGGYAAASYPAQPQPPAPPAGSFVPPASPAAAPAAPASTPPRPPAPPSASDPLAPPQPPTTPPTAPPPFEPPTPPTGPQNPPSS